MMHSVTIIHCIIRDYHSLHIAIRDSSPDYIFHLAAQSYPKTSFDAPVDTYDTNISGTTNLLEAVKKNNIDPNLPDFVSDIDLNNVTYGEDGTGDLTNVDNIKFLGKQFQKNGMAHLITADGGFDVSNDHCSQEKQSYILLLCQVVSALECQAFDGAFIMKVFDCYSNEMTELLYILSIHYTEVHITKPFSSRPCNSEKYIVCKGFKGITQKERIALRFLVENSENIRLKEQPSQLFINTLSNINQVFSESQIAALRSTLDYATNTKWVQKPVDMSNWFINRYSIN